VSIGDLVGKGEPTLLATISKLDPMWFYCNVSEVDYIQAQDKSHQLGREIDTLPLTLILANGKAYSEPGKFVFIDRAVNTKTATIRIRAEFPNPEREPIAKPDPAVKPDSIAQPDRILRPGMFARVRVNLPKKPDCITVPERAIVELQGKSFVWRVGKDNKVSQQEVTRGEQVGPQIIINKGLKPGDRIVVEGINKLREGMPVQIFDAAAKSAEPPTTSKE
jgi:membrane fusion protein (multidrug efflux system)